MTDNEIIKAFLLHQSLELINLQKAEIERLKKLLEEEEAKFKECAKRFYKVGVKDFAERLRYVSKWSQSNAFSDRFVTVRDIDDLEEEMVGAENV